VNYLDAPQLRFNEFSEAIKLYSLDELGKFIGGGTPDKENIGFWKGEIPWISSSDVENEDIHNIAISRLITSEAIEKSATKLIPSNSVAFVSRVGVGKVAINKTPLCTSQDFTNFVPKEINPNYIGYFFQKHINLLKRYSQGTSIKGLTSNELKKIKVSVVSNQEQQKIADFLSSVDKKISLLKEKHALLEQYKKGLMQKLFSQEIRFKDENGNDFPDWQEKSLSQVLEIQVRETPKPTEKYLALGIRSHMKGTFQKPNFDPEAIMMDKLFIVRPNDLIVNITFAWEGAIAIAKNDDDGGLVSHRFPTYTFKEGESTHRYFKHIIMLKRFKYMLDLISPGGAGRNRVLSKKEFLKLKWNLPSVEEQLKIADFLDALDKKAELVSDQIEQTQTFKKGLLQQMFV
jgi:type I restriction enzyme S subunit